jgi:hypothetical protein
MARGASVSGPLVLVMAVLARLGIVACLHAVDMLFVVREKKESLHWLFLSAENGSGWSTRIILRTVQLYHEGS